MGVNVRIKKKTKDWSVVCEISVFVRLLLLIFNITLKKRIDLIAGCTVAQLVALLPCSKKVLGSIPSRGSFCMEFACSPRACVGSHQVLWLPPTVQRHVC
ncbi:hypothetical protein ATANTOWER_010813 [Ataeniobius toweri]|uniref:Uncharacterized protein n=1 Tax=Ataeniobius toweri TaxID=208326 RepID=A0ABU7BY42_9TELE|nr:hypothetical protein [Ataeniobius toweri]